MASQPALTLPQNTRVASAEPRRITAASCQMGPVDALCGLDSGALLRCLGSTEQLVERSGYEQATPVPVELWNRRVP